MSDLILGPVIVTSYHGATNTRQARITASHRRDSDNIWCRYLNYDDALSAEENHLKAAEKLLTSWPYENSLKIVGRGHDYRNYFFLCQSV